MTEFHCEHALIDTGWAEDVTIQCDPDGVITRIFTATEAAPNAIHLGTVLPGLANLHSHAFQRGMAGLSEVKGPGEDSFWSWRQLMYQFLDTLTPDDVEAIAALAYCEMLESGFTRVAEFHYLHHDVDGSTYDNPAEMALRVCAAADETGIGMTLLPVLYRWAGFNHLPPAPEQRRFINSLESYERLWLAAKSQVENLPEGRIGVAPHSLRAASIEDIHHLTEIAGSNPIHIHISEQIKEVEDCLAATGARPVQYLLDQHDLSEQWCLVHATHLDAKETSGIAKSGSVVGLCPLTEANLGDGIFPALEFTADGGRFGIGSDSHIRIDLAEELRLLEYGQRLLHRKRNLLARSGQSTGRFLYENALLGGAKASGIGKAGISTGASADLVELNTEHSALCGRAGDALLDSWLFCGDGRQVQSVYVSGKAVVRDGKCLARETIEMRYSTIMKRIAERIGRYEYN